MWGDWSFMEYQDEQGHRLTPEKLREAREKLDAWKLRQYRQGAWVPDDRPLAAEGFERLGKALRDSFPSIADIPCAPASPTPFMGNTLRPAARPTLRLIRGGKP